jgi:hypothetical protein
MTAFPILESAVECARLGLSVHYQKGKIAFESGWNSGLPKTEAQLRRDYQADWNIGFQTGHRSKISGKPVGVLDPDLRSDEPRHAAEMDAAVRELVGGVEPTVRTGSGGSHFYFVMGGKNLPTKTIVLRQSKDEVEWQEDGKTKKGHAWRIEFLWDRHACTLPPSIHPETGKPYTWINGGLSKIGSPPDTLLKALQAAESPPPGGWPRREPIVGELKPVKPFDPVLLPEALRPWIMDEARRMPCPPDFVAATAIVALSILIGARCAIKPKPNDTWLVVPNLWGGIVGDPSARKTPAATAAMKPMDRLIAIAHKSFEDDMHSYELENLTHEARESALKDKLKAAAKDRKKGDPEMIAAELQTLHDQAPKKPILRRFKTNDPTVESLGELLRDNPHGLLVFRDEIVGLLASWEREGREGDRAFYLEAYNGNASFDVDRIGRGHVHIANLCASLFGGIQPDKLAGYLRITIRSLDNDGLFQRFQLLVFPDPQIWEWRDESPDKYSRDRVYEVFEQLANFNPVHWGAIAKGEHDKFDTFLFSGEAQEVFVQWSTELYREKIETEDDAIIRQHLSKYDSLFCSLALIFHLVECAAHGLRSPVSRQSAIRAAGWCDYLESHARRCYGLLRDAGLRAARTLARKLERGELRTGFTAYHVRRHQWSNLQTADDVESALDWLEDSGWIRRLPRADQPRGGRPTVRYEVHPDLPLEPGK